MMRLVISVALLLLCSCDSDVVTTHFATVQDARAKGAFERGWLPPKLPDSARNITETNNLDLNRGIGSFDFSASDYIAFASQLSPASPEVIKLYWSSHAADGFSVYTFTDLDGFWTLALHPRGRGYYTIEARH